MGRASRAKQTIPCIARNADGTRCGRRLPLGTSPQVCHLHRAAAAGGNNGTPFGIKKTPRERLEKIAADDSHPNQLQAIKTLLDLDAVADHDVDAQAWKAFMGEITDEERAALNQLRAQARLLQHQVWARKPESRPSTYHAPTLVCTDEHPPGTLFIGTGDVICEAAPMPEPPPVITLVQPQEADDDEEEVEEETFDPSKHGPEFFDGPDEEQS